MDGAVIGTWVQRAREGEASASYLSERRIESDHVSIEILFAYKDAIVNDRLRAHSENTWDSLSWLWNKCVRDVLGRPKIIILRASKRKTYILDWSAFPASLKEEVYRYIERQSGRDLSEDGPPKPWREAVAYLRTLMGLSEPLACQIVAVVRTTVRYGSKRPQDTRAAREASRACQRTSAFRISTAIYPVATGR